jgi:hypothetical protein
MANVLEVLFLNSFLEVPLGFFLLPVGEISSKKKTLYIKAEDPRHCTYLRNLNKKTLLYKVCFLSIFVISYPTKKI